MPVSTTCPNCKALFRLPEELAGRKVKCQKCANLFLVPNAAAGTTMPGERVPMEAKPAPEPAQPSVPVTTIALPPMPMDLPSAPLPNDDKADDDGRYRDNPKKPPAVGKKRSADSDRPSRSRPGDKPKAGSSSTGIVLVIGGLAALACLTCAGATGIWYAVSDKPVAKKDGFKDGRKKDKFDGFKDFAKKKDVVGNEGFVQVPSRPPFDGFKDGKLPPPPPPGPPGAISVVFGPDGTFTSNDAITLVDPFNNVQRRHKLYIVRMEKGYTYQIDMSTPNGKILDAYLFLRDDLNNYVTEDDDSAGNVSLNARIIFTPQETAIFRIEATYCINDNPNPTGNYTLTVRHVK